MTKQDDFVEVDTKRNTVIVKVNAGVFPIDIIYGAAYSLIDRAYVILDGDPGSEIYAIMKPRNFQGSLEELGRLFYDELLNFAFYTVQSIRNKEIKEALVRATVGEPLREPEEEEDAEDIAKLWEEKFGEANDKSSSE